MLALNSALACIASGSPIRGEPSKENLHGKRFSTARAPREAATAHLCIVGEEGEVKGAGKTHSQPLCEAKLVKLLFFRPIILCRRLQVGENKVEQRRRSRPGTVLTRPRQGKSEKSVVAQLQPR